MTTDARAQYLAVLLKRLEAHEGPVGDAQPYMERLDVLTGVNLEMKQLTAGSSFAPSPEAAEGEPPEIEHGSGQQVGDGASVATPSEQERGAQQIGAATPDPLPVAHEDPQQAVVETGISAPPPSDSPAAASPKAVPPQPYGLPSTVQIRKPRDKTTVEMPCACGCGTPLHIPRWEIARDPDKKFFRNRTHYHDYQRSPEGGRRASQYGGILRDKSADTTPAPSDVAQIREPATFDVTNVEPPAHGLSAVVANPPVEAAPTKFVCTCPHWWATKTLGWRKEDPNEGHHEDCALYRKGGHRWPLPEPGQKDEPPYTVTCGWCGERREVDRRGIPWAMSEMNPVNGGKVPV